MARNRVHTGDTAKIEQWFRDNPEKETTSLDLMELFGLKRFQVNNAITALKKKNIVVPGETFSIGRAHFTPYRLRNEREKRNEFQVARPVARPQKVEAIPAPVHTTFDIGRVIEPLMRLVNGVPKDRLEAINANTIIVWNSPAQRDYMFNKALMGFEE